MDGNGPNHSEKFYPALFATTFPMSESGQFRDKLTDVENVVPAISTWPREKTRKFQFTNLDGGTQRIDPAEFAHLDPYPMPMPVDREGYAKEENSDRYWASGLADWFNVNAAVKKYSGEAKPVRLLDFGCASGRFLRHAFLQPVEQKFECWGCDLAPANIDWIRRHLPAGIHCQANSSDPSLDFEDDTFDLVTAFSVFTHIDADETEWLLELKRITKPGGLLYITTHNNASWKKVSSRPGTLRQFEHQNRFEENLKTDPSMFSNPMPRERLVFRKDREEVYNCNVWHRDDYIGQQWSKHLEILTIADCAHGSFQSPVIMRA